MRQPKIRKGLMHRLRRVAWAYEMPVTKMLSHILTVSLDELEGKQDDYTVCIPMRPAAPQREEFMSRTSEGLLGDCVFALEALLMSPALNLDCLGQATRDAIEVAHETLNAVKAALNVHEGKD